MHKRPDIIIHVSHFMLIFKRHFFNLSMPSIEILEVNIMQHFNKKVLLNLVGQLKAKKITGHD